MNTAVLYRKDIDGLRAIAVLSVVFFHAGIAGFPGGYVGVDIFFVISGYLISTIILREIEQGGFNFSRFYERRVRRIFPALFFMLCLATILAGFFFTPNDFNEVGKSLYSVLFFFSNFHFLDKQGYFENNAEIQLFLHTWSLSVEEQFYILFPAFLVLLMKCSEKWRRPLFFTLFTASLVSASVWVYMDNSAAFYLSPLRFWELMFGAILALNYLPKIRQRVALELLATAGLVMIVVPIFVYDDDSLFPGFFAVPVCLGTTLLIYTGGINATCISAFLSNRVLVFFGLISYSLYLWHWPLFVFREYLYLEPSFIGAVGFVVLSVVLAWLSWRFVERPFRSKQRFNQKAVFKMAAVSTLVLLLSAAALDITNGVPSRFPGQIQLLAKDADRHPKLRKCGGILPGNELKLDECMLGSGNKGAQMVFALWGDSHAEVLAPGLDQLASNHGQKGYYFSKSACPPMNYAEKSKKSKELDRCSSYHQQVLTFLESSNVKNVIIAARWTKLPAMLNDSYIKAGLMPVFSRLLGAGKTVWFVHQVPEASKDVPRAMIGSYALGGELGAEHSVLASGIQQSNYRAQIDELHNLVNFNSLDPQLILCAETCKISDGGRSLYKDDNHLSVYGSLKIAPLFAPVFR